MQTLLLTRKRYVQIDLYRIKVFFPEKALVLCGHVKLCVHVLFQEAREGGGSRKRPHEQTYVPSQRDREMEEQVEALNVSNADDFYRSHSEGTGKVLFPQVSVC